MFRYVMSDVGKDNLVESLGLAICLHMVRRGRYVLSVEQCAHSCEVVACKLGFLSVRRCNGFWYKMS